MPIQVELREEWGVSGINHMSYVYMILYDSASTTISLSPELTRKSSPQTLPWQTRRAFHVLESCRSRCHPTSDPRSGSSNQAPRKSTRKSMARVPNLGRLLDSQLVLHISYINPHAFAGPQLLALGWNDFGRASPSRPRRASHPGMAIPGWHLGMMWSLCQMARVSWMSRWNLKDWKILGPIRNDENCIYSCTRSNPHPFPVLSIWRFSRRALLCTALLRCEWWGSLDPNARWGELWKKENHWQSTQSKIRHHAICCLEPRGNACVWDNF